jgi:universal stress protein A
MNVFRILVPVDFSSCSTAALNAAVLMARARESAAIHILHVAPGLVPFYDAELGILEPSRLVHRLRMRALEHSVELDLPCDEEVVFGEPVDEILKKAVELQSDLIVMGTHGRSGLDRVLVGSVAESVLRKAPCPVLCVKNLQSGEDESYPPELAPSRSSLD